ncbi:MAG TPA: HAMP domain-containing sensor histidine kinase [Thermomicrobiales bacterium]|nr:HAMP domain-containing sensor histidine kinase [Thermomicrobiales bacterium]
MLLSLLVLGSGIYFTTSRSLNADIESRLRTVYDSYRRDPGTWYVSQRQIQLRPNPNPFASSGVYIQIMDSTGVVQARSENLGGQTLPVEPEVLERNRQLESILYTTEIGEQHLRVFTAPILVGGNLIAFVQVAEPLAPLERTLGELRRNLAFGGVVATLVAGIGAGLVGGAVMRPLSRMAGTARTIGRTGDLSRRLEPPRTGDEAQLLAETFNDMLARLEETFSAQRRFVADASHELRTPLTALRANGDIMLRQVEHGVFDRVDLIEGLTDMQAEVDRMTRLVQNLLILARADVGWRPELETLDLIDVVRDAARIASPLTKGQRFELDAPMPMNGHSPAIPVLGNADQLTQLILILLDNAFTYSSPDTDVTLSIAHNDDDAVITVTDTGPGIAEEHLRRIFERFYRTDDARLRATGGAGLGLSIARWIVTVHGGDIDADSAPGEGTTVTIRIPLADAGRDTARSRPEMSASAP